MNVNIPVLDQLIMGLEKRFDNSNNNSNNSINNNNTNNNTNNNHMGGGLHIALLQ